MTARGDTPWAVGGLHRPIDQVPPTGPREVGCMCDQVYVGVPLYCPLHTPALSAAGAPSPAIPMPAVDDRIVLPLQQTRDAATALCGWWCGRRRPDGHVDPCLVPLLEQRDALLAEQHQLTQISGDCQDPIKHGACSGCACTCHRHHRRTS